MIYHYVHNAIMYLQMKQPRKKTTNLPKINKWTSSNKIGRNKNR